jgi:protein-S-isoprenylcysteine O-methyltransferase Ste14
MSMGYDKGKFRFSETFNNSDGKTSGSGFIGVITGLVGAFLIFAGVFAFFFKYPEAMEFLAIGLKVLGIYAGLMGIRKFGAHIVEAKNGKKVEVAEVTEVVKDDERG